jgi:hypothetical protein
MSLPATIAQVILDTVIGRLALLFLSGATGDMTAAREAARQMLTAHSPETPDELTLAAEIISLQLHTLEALSSAADPDLPLNKVVRLRGSAVSLSRESHKARRRLDQLQRARRAGTTTQPARAPTEGPAPQPAPMVEKAPLENAPPENAPAKKTLDPVDAARQAIKIAKQTDGANWQEAFQKRQIADRIAENLKKNQAQHAILTAPTPPKAQAVASAAQ